MLLLESPGYGDLVIFSTSTRASSPTRQLPAGFYQNPPSADSAPIHDSAGALGRARSRLRVRPSVGSLLRFPIEACGEVCREADLARRPRAHVRWDQLTAVALGRVQRARLGW